MQTQVEIRSKRSVSKNQISLCARNSRLESKISNLKIAWRNPIMHKSTCLHFELQGVMSFYKLK